MVITSNGVGAQALQQASGFRLFAYRLGFSLHKNGESYDSPFLYLKLAIATHSGGDVLRKF